MATPQAVVLEYERTAPLYDLIPDIPLGLLEAQLITHTLGDASGLTVLDLGGGSGHHAREAIDAGAKLVDIVDVSPDMLQKAREVEVALGREGRVLCYEADVSQPLSHLALSEKQYDIVMANWVFDHAGTDEMLEGMWRNVATYLKPGGRFLGVRLARPFPGSKHLEKYGVILKDLKEIPGGVTLTVCVKGGIPFHIEIASREVSFSGSTKMHEKYGLKDVQAVPYDHADIVAKDIPFWEEFLEKPFSVLITGVKG